MAAALSLSLFLSLYLPASVYAEDQAEEQTDNPASEPMTEQTDEQMAAAESGKDLPAEAANSERILPNSWANQLSGVRQHLALLDRSDEHIEMVAEEQAFSGYFIEQRSPAPQGAVLILPSLEQHSQWPSGSAALREQLPDYGWATLAIELPQPPAIALPPRGDLSEEASAMTMADSSAPKVTLNGEAPQGLSTANNSPANNSPSNSSPADSSANAEGSSSSAQGSATGTDQDNGISQNSDIAESNDQINENGEPALPRLTGLPQIPTANAIPAASEPPKIDAIEQYRQQVQARIRAALLLLNQRGIFNLVIIAQGNSASWALAVANEQSAGRNANQRGLSLVLLDASADPHQSLALRQQMQDLSLPMLDLISVRGEQHSLSNQYQRARRLGAMRNQGRDNYQQISLENYALDNHSSNVVLRRIRGWLKSHAAGTQLSRR